MGVNLLIVDLEGGVGAARFLTGLTRLVKNEDLSVIVNTGDDIELFGLHVSPDVDIVTYTLAGIVDEEKGWGVRDDTFQCLEMLKKRGMDTWFNLGDKDLATHIYRTDRLNQGATLSEITKEVCRSLGLKIQILTMTNDKFETRVKTRDGSIHFEEYFVRKQWRDEVLGIEFAGSEMWKPCPGVLEVIMDAEMVVVCPSNPVVSISTILAVEGVRDALKRTNARVVGVSPIVEGLPIKGPADKMLRVLGVEVSAFGVAKFYSDFLDTFIIDTKDAGEKSRIEKLGLNVKVTNTLMKSLEDKVALAKVVLESNNVNID
jgi:LPPG:FO 2-phospho-L-lactate transferase